MTWRSQAIFVSGTFRDFHAERDAIARRVLPALEEELAALRVHVEIVDLRVGVDTLHLDEDHARQELVLKVCLGDIQRCRPFVLVLIGDRYGWIPPIERAEAAIREVGFRTAVRDKSVTELEIEFGLWSNAAVAPRGFVYFRSLDYSGMGEQDAIFFSDARAANFAGVSKHDRRLARERALRLDALKHRLRRDRVVGLRCRDYTATWDSSTRRVTGLDGFVAQVLADLLEELRGDAHMRFESRGHAVTALERFFHDRSRGFRGRARLVDQLVDFALAPDDPDSNRGKRLLVTGGPGAGKSALLGALYERLEGTGAWVLAHAAGIEPMSDSIDHLLRAWIERLQILGQSDTKPRITYSDAPELGPLSLAEWLEALPEIEDAEHVFDAVLGMVSSSHRIVLLIDGLERLERSARAEQSTWMGRIFRNVRLIATAQPGAEAEAFRVEERLDLPPLEREEASEVAASAYGRFHRNANSEVVDVLLSKTTREGSAAHWTPLWIVGAVEQLNLLDVDDFRRAEDRDDGDKEQHLHALVMGEAERLPGDLDELSERVFERAGRLLSDGQTEGRALMMGVVTLLALSRAGLRERDLAALVPMAASLLEPGSRTPTWNGLAFATARRALRSHLVCLGADERWSLHHSPARAFAVSRLGDRGDLRERLHGLIAAHLGALPAGDELRESEAAYHLLQARDAPALVAWLNSSISELGFESAATALALAANSGSGAAFVIELFAAGLDAHYIRRLAPLLLAMLDKSEWQRPLAVRLELAWSIMQALRQLEREAPSSELDALSVAAFAHVGNALEEQGRLDEARIIHGGCLSIQLRLSEQEGIRPEERVTWEWKAMDTHETAARLDALRGRPSEALDAYRLRLSHLRNSVESLPEVLELQHQLASTLCLVGDAERARGSLDAAMQAYEEGMAIAKDLTGRKPGRLDWNRTASLLRIRTGIIHELRGDRQAATEAYERGHLLYGWFTRSVPEQLDWQSEAASNLRLIGNVMLAENPERALSLNQISAKKFRWLIGSRPERVEWQCSLAKTLAGVAHAHLALGDSESALADFQESTSLLRTATSVPPWSPDFFESSEAPQGRAEWTCDLAESLRGLGEVCRRRGAPEEALRFELESVAALRRLVVQLEPHPVWLHDLALSLGGLAATLMDLGRHSDADAHLAEALELLDTLDASEHLFPAWLHDRERLRIMRRF